MKNLTLFILLGVISVTSARAEIEKIQFAGNAVTLEKPDWLVSVSKAIYANKNPGRRYPTNYHETQEGKLTFYSEIDRDSEGKTIEEIHKTAVTFQEESFADVLTWNRKKTLTISGKEFSLLDFNIKDPDGDEDFTFRMIVLDALVNGKVSHTVITIHDKDGEKTYLEKFYKWIEL